MLFSTNDIPKALLALEQHSPKTYYIDHIAIDSRSANLGRHVAFISLLSSSGDGHQYIAQAYAAGVRTFIISKEIDRANYPDACWIRVADTLLSLQSYAQARRQASPARVVAITGSNGKTVLKEMLYSLLYRDVKGLYRSPGSYNSQIGVALSLIAMDEHTSLAIIEAGISQPDEMARLEAMIKPDDVLITNIGTAHLENFPSQEDLTAEKMLLCKDAKSIIHTPEEDTYTELMALAPFVDRANRHNLRLAIAYIQAHFPHIFPKLAEYITELRPIEMRLEVKENGLGRTLINDSYSNDLESLEIALEAQHRLGGKAVVLSPIEQSPLSPEEQGQRIIQLLNTYQVERAYLVGWSLGSLTYGALSIVEATSVDVLLTQHRDSLLREHALLVKGARRYRLEQLIQSLSKREHATSLEVNLSVMQRNLAFYRSLLPHDAALICMIKADAYGLGALEIARSLETAQVSYLAVAVADEGKHLRQAGIQKPIIVMNPAPDSLDTLIRYNLGAEVYSMDMLRIFAEQTANEEYPHLHLKVDSGMHRLGFRLEDIPEIVEVMRHYQIRLETVFSHLAGADEARLDNFTHSQAKYLLNFYNELMTTLQQRTDYNQHYPRLHLLNTAGLERFSHEYAFDGGRLGIGLYGYSPSGRKEVQSVAQLKTRILQVKTIPAGEPIGYGCRASFDEEKLIAIIPIGYADGLHRRYGNGRWSVNIKGVLCPIVGNVCMDACMIDVTNTCAQAGDEVIVFGDNLTPILQMAEVGDTIPYEILTSISPRVARVYLKE